MILVTGGAGFIGGNFVLDWLANPAAEGIVTKVNAFFTKDWADFRKLVEATPIKKFKEIETIK